MKDHRPTRPLRYQLRPLVVSVTIALASWSAAGLAGDKVHEHNVQYNEAYQSDAKSGTQGHATRHGMKHDEQPGKAMSQAEGGEVWNFDRLDKDGDDRLSEAEFDAYREKMDSNRADAAPAAPSGGAVPSSPHQVDALREFESIDDDKDGFVTRAEMKSARKAFDDAGDPDMKKSDADQS
ncbi:MAG: EF-hand domain-containing protein [Gammaproteobacteria bacterium]